MTTQKNTRVPRLCRHKASDQGVVRLDGRDYYCGRWGTKAAQVEYDRLIAIYLANGRRMPCNTADAVEISIVELIADYWVFAQQHYRKPDGRETSELSCLQVALRPLREMFGKEAARDFGPLKLKAVRQALIDQGLARRSINIHVGRVRRLFKWAVENEKIPPEALHALQAVPGLQRGRTDAHETEPVQPVPEAHVEAALPHLSPQVRAMVQLMTLTGMRVGEVSIMRTMDVDRDGELWIYTPSSHKTEHHGRDRTVPLGPKAQVVLRPFLRADPGAYVFTPKEAMETHYAAQRRSRKTPITPPRPGANRTRAGGRDGSTKRTSRVPQFGKRSPGPA